MAQGNRSPSNSPVGRSWARLDAVEQLSDDPTNLWKLDEEAVVSVRRADNGGAFAGNAELMSERVLLFEGIEPVAVHPSDHDVCLYPAQCG